MLLKIRLPGLDRIERQQRRILETLEIIVTQNDLVAAAVAQLQASDTELRTLLVNIGGDVQSLKDKIDQLPTEGPLDPALVTAIQDEAASLVETTSGFRSLDESTPPATPDPGGDPGEGGGFFR